MIPRILILPIALLVVPATSIVLAQLTDGSPGITVSGFGEASAKPDVIELDMRIAASAELTADAITKYRDAKRRTLKAFNDLKIKELAIDELGMTVGNENTGMNNNHVIIDGNAPAAAKEKIEISGPIRLRLSGIASKSAEEALDLVGKLLDTAKDAGLTVGPTAAEMQTAYQWGRQVNGQGVRFVVHDLDKHREAAYQKAVADARHRAERLARLNGVQVGDVLSVSETEVTNNDETDSVSVNGWTAYPALTAMRQPQLASNAFADIPFRVRLHVRFAIKGK